MYAALPAAAKGNADDGGAETCKPEALRYVRTSIRDRRRRRTAADVMQAIASQKS